ncbi:hypothetical protein FJZ31_06170 [Candidatus Poribacteria bacterium]|nr:hypothetical protein [Candidatus Poribacteria bacterium]
MTQQNHEVNIAKYAKVELKKQDITLLWEEPRDIFKVVVRYSELPALSNVKLQYWQDHWPHQRVPKGAVVGAGRSGWMAADDWYNGEWKNADVNVAVEGNNAVYTFNPINVKEFPDIKDFDATYRRTLKIRLLFDGERPEIKAVEAYSDSVWKETEVKIEWGSDFTNDNPLAPFSPLTKGARGLSKGDDREGHLEIYNGELLEIEPLSENVKVNEDNIWKSDGKPGSIKAKLLFAYTPPQPPLREGGYIDVNSFDKTIVTVRATTRSFSFLIDEMEAGAKIFVKDFDVLVTKAAADVSYSSFKEEWESNHQPTLYDRIKALPEQTFEKAWNDMPKKKSRGFMPLGCDGGRQKFGVDQNGDVFCPKNWIPRVKGKDTDRLLWEGREIRYRFGFPAVEPTSRYIEKGYLPIIHSKWEADSIVYEQSAFVTLLGADILSGERMQGDDPTILLVKVTLTNTGDDLRTVNLSLKSKHDVEEKLEARDGFVFAIKRSTEEDKNFLYEPKMMRYFVDIMDKGLLKSADGNLSYEINLTKNEFHSIYFKIPFITLTEEKEFELTKNTDYETELSKVKKFWEDRISTGTQIITPNETLNNFYRAHLTHMLITDDREVGSDRYASRVGTFPYGVFPDESCMCISDFDRRGYKKEAQERLEMLIHYQGTVGVPGTYSTIEGQYYGAGGYECGGYNKNHGWVLWALGEHYWYHRDKEWLNCVAPSIVKACDWIIKECQSTKKFDSTGKKVIEYGFLPAGSLEDVKDFGFWLATNAPTYWGFKNAAKALLDIGHPEGERLLREAEAYGKDVRAGFREAMTLSPVVKLRDGTYAPHFPPRLYQRGRGFGWLRETLEGAIHLIRSEMLEPWSEESTWILKDYEDNLYISDRYGYSVDDFERDWFSLGGFSMQSNLLCHTIPYLWRDEPKHFLRGYFNAFVSAFYPDICALVEHALPTLADHNGVWFKPSDEAQSTFWLRLMLISESGNELNLAMATPREWFEDGKSIKIERAATYLGDMGYEIHSEVGNGKITMILEPPARNAPEAVNVRFRHPKEKPMREVMVNGKRWLDFDAEKELIKLGKITEKTEIIALY